MCVWLALSYVFFICFFEWFGDHRYLHVLTHSFPTRLSSDLRFSQAFADDTAIGVPPRADGDARVAAGVLHRSEILQLPRREDVVPAGDQRDRRADVGDAAMKVHRHPPRIAVAVVLHPVPPERYRLSVHSLVERAQRPVSPLLRLDAIEAEQASDEHAPDRRGRPARHHAGPAHRVLDRKSTRLNSSH